MEEINESQIFENCTSIRKVDVLGRITLPMELRDDFNIKEKDSMQIFKWNEFIILKKHKNSCTFCNSKEDLKSHNNKFICKNCLDEIYKSN